MKQVTPKTEKEIDDLLARIKGKTGFTQEEIAKKIGYNRSYISQAKKTDSEKLYNALWNGFRSELENITFTNEHQSDYGKDKTIETLSESVRKLTDNNTKMIDALLDKIAVLDSIKVSLEQTIPANMSLLTKMALDGQKESMVVVMEQFSNLNKNLTSLAAAVNKKPLQKQKR